MLYLAFAQLRVKSHLVSSDVSVGSITVCYRQHVVCKLWVECGVTY